MNVIDTTQLNSVWWRRVSHMIMTDSDFTRLWLAAPTTNVRCAV